MFTLCFAMLRSEYQQCADGAQCVLSGLVKTPFVSLGACIALVASGTPPPCDNMTDLTDFFSLHISCVIIYLLRKGALYVMSETMLSSRMSRYRDG